MNLILSLLFALFVAIFAVNNADPVKVRFLGQVVETSFVYVIFGSAGLGAVSALLLSLPGRLRAGARTREFRQQIVRLQSELKVSADRLRQLEAASQTQTQSAENQPSGGLG